MFGMVLKELAQGTLEDYVKDFFKDAIGEGIGRFQQKQKNSHALKVASGKAVTEFLKLIQDQLEDADYEEILIRQ